MISIAQRLRPFSHQPGTRCLIPGTPYFVEVFPTLLRFYDLKEENPVQIKEMALEIPGAPFYFSIFQDLTRGCVTVVSDKITYHILPSLEVIFKKHPHLKEPSFHERISLGSHKKQEWEAIRKRGDFRDIFPLWFSLGSITPLEEPLKSKEGVFSLLEICREKIEGNAPEHILPSFREIFLAGFSHTLLPRLHDEERQGIRFPDPRIPHQSPLHLLKEGAALIRSLFLKMEGTQIVLLPHLPPQFFSGRAERLACPPWGEISFEWTKKELKKAVFYAKQTGQVFLHFPSSLKTFRIRKNLQEKGIVLSKGEALEINSDTVYLLDHFKK